MHKPIQFANGTERINKDHDEMAFFMQYYEKQVVVLFGSIGIVQLSKGIPIKTSL